jgi:hypothetical protein
VEPAGSRLHSFFRETIQRRISETGDADPIRPIGAAYLHNLNVDGQPAGPALLWSCRSATPGPRRTSSERARLTTDLHHEHDPVGHVPGIDFTAGEAFRPEELNRSEVIALVSERNALCGRA